MSLPADVRASLMEAAASQIKDDIQRAATQNDWGRVLQLVRSFAYKLDVWGRRSDLQDLLSLAIEAATQVHIPADELWSRLRLADLDLSVGRSAEASQGYLRGLELATQLGAKRQQYDAQLGLAKIALRDGDVEQAQRVIEEILSGVQRLEQTDTDARECELEALHALATIAFEEKVFERARDMFATALGIARDLKLRDVEARELRWIGRTFGELGGDGTLARTYIQQSLAISERRQHTYNIAKCHEALARLEEDQSVTSALVLYQQALTALQQLSSPDANEVRERVDFLQARIRDDSLVVRQDAHQRDEHIAGGRQ